MPEMRPITVRTANKLRLPKPERVQCEQKVYTGRQCHCTAVVTLLGKTLCRKHLVG